MSNTILAVLQNSVMKNSMTCGAVAICSRNSGASEPSECLLSWALLHWTQFTSNNAATAAQTASTYRNRYQQLMEVCQQSTGVPHEFSNSLQARNMLRSGHTAMAGTTWFKHVLVMNLQLLIHWLQHHRQLLCIRHDGFHSVSRHLHVRRRLVSSLQCRWQRCIHAVH